MSAECVQSESDILLQLVFCSRACVCNVFVRRKRGTAGKLGFLNFLGVSPRAPSLFESAFFDFSYVPDQLCHLFAYSMRAFSGLAYISLQ